LQLEDVFERPIEAVGPQMRSVCSVNQLGGDAYPAARLADRALKNVANAQLAADLLYVDGLAPAGEARIAGDDKEPADAAERGEDLFDHPVGELFLLRIAAHVLKREDRDRRLVGQWQGRALTRLTPAALGPLSRIAGEGGPRRVSGGVGEGRAHPEDV